MAIFFQAKPRQKGRTSRRRRPQAPPAIDEILPATWQLAAMIAWLKTVGEVDIADSMRREWLTGRLAATEALELLEAYAAVARLHPPGWLPPSVPERG